MIEGHPFDQVPGALVRVCWCGKWPDHHTHTGDPRACGCDECRDLRRIDERHARIELTPWQRELIVHAYPDPRAVLDLIERLNDLPDGATAEVYEIGLVDGPPPTRPTEPE